MEGAALSAPSFRVGGNGVPLSRMPSPPLVSDSLHTRKLFLTSRESGVG